MRGACLFASIAILGCAGESSSDDGGSSEGTGTTPSTSSPSTTDMPSTTNNPSTTSATDPTTADSTSDDSDPTLTSTDPTGDTDSTTGGPDGPNVDVSDPQLYEFELDPVVLDPTCVENLELQFAHLDTRAEPLGKLVFFLSGYTNVPSNWRDHGRQIASWGFHVVEPHYANDWDCGDMGGTCGTDTRWEALVGEDISPVIVASRADSAEGRVVTMLKHLAEVHPQGDWGWFLDDNDELRYEHVIIAGISHGASSSGLFGTRRPFSRVVMHSGAWWEADDASMTPVSEWYGLAHTDDPQYDGILSGWEGSGMVGMPTSIDEMDPPYGDARQLVTAVPNGYPHCSTCVSPDSPLDMGSFVFDPAWRVMYGAPPAE